VIKLRLAKYLQPNTDVTIYKLSQETGISHPMMYNLNSGKQKTLRTDTLARIIKALRALTGQEITPNDLLEYTDDTPKKSAKQK
jgi:DNA-binding Xre family transcriptional regulator